MIYNVYIYTILSVEIPGLIEEIQRFGELLEKKGDMYCTVVPRKARFTMYLDLNHMWLTESTT